MDSSTLKNALDMCSLIRNVLKGEKTDTAGMDVPQIYELSKRQTLTAITYMALELSDATEDMDPELAGRWKREKDMAVRKNLLMNAAREELFQAMEQAGIWYMPLKGSDLAQLYPKIGMRQMADNDVLFDRRFREDVKQIMCGMGYQTEEYGISNHDVYMKKPVYNFEMHVDLFKASDGRHLCDYYREVESFLLSDGGFKRRFRPEDFYIYMLAHGYKHFSNNGNGIRFLVDCYVFLSRQEQMDRTYILGELKKLQIGDFEQQICDMAFRLFGTAQALTQTQEQMLILCISANTYGSDENRFTNGLQRLQPDGAIRGTTRLKYLWRRVWPDKEWFANNYPLLDRFWILKPFFLIWRIFRSILTRGKNVLYELRFVFRKK